MPIIKPKIKKTIPKTLNMMLSSDDFTNAKITSNHSDKVGYERW